MTATSENILVLAERECDRIRLGLMSGSIPYPEVADALEELAKLLHDSHTHTRRPRTMRLNEGRLYG